MFAASPDAYTDPLNEHDTDCGFRPGDDTMAVRHDEDMRAPCSRLGATPRWLPLLPELARRTRAIPIAVPPGAVEAIVATIADVRSAVRRRAARARRTSITRPVTRRRSRPVINAGAVPWLWYSDLPYVFIPNVLAARFRALHKLGYTASPACPSVSHDFAAKWRAFTQYTTQVDVLERLWQLQARLERAGEQYWALD